MRHIIEIRGRQIAVNASSGSQVALYKTLYSRLTDDRLDALAAETVDNPITPRKLAPVLYLVK